MSSESFHLLLLVLAGCGAGTTCVPSSTDGQRSLERELREQAGRKGKAKGCDGMRSVSPVPGIIPEGGAPPEAIVQDGRGWEQPGRESLTRMLSCQW